MVTRASALLAATILAASSWVPASAGKAGLVISNAACRPDVSRLASGFGSPDDLAVLGSHILFGDIRAGVVASVNGGHVRVLARSFKVPEGIAVTGRDSVVVVEQGLNRLDTINLKHHRRRVLLHLANTTGKEGVDGISRIHGALIIPDSPYGSILKLAGRTLTTLATGLSRPTDAVSFAGGLAIADEDANAIWLLRRGRLSRLASVPTPDDVAKVAGMLVAVTLGDGSLWEIQPQVRRLINGFEQPQGLVTTGPRSVAVAASSQNTIFQVKFSEACLGIHRK